MKLADLYARISPVLRPLGFPYSFLMRQRRAMYRSGWLSGYSPSCPCVSVGNIAWGGTGKTPLTGWLLAWAEKRGIKAVVLSRGYGGKPGPRPLLVRADTPVEQSGDEPLLLARAFPSASVVVFPHRSEAARFAENHLSPDILILDDGMQHLRVRRDADLVLLRPEDLSEDWNRVIPSGLWREGASALSSASAFAIKADEKKFASVDSAARERLASYGKPLFSFSLMPVGLKPLFPEKGSEMLSPEIYRKTPYILLSGVGNPCGVEETARTLLGREPVQHFDFDDHHRYSTVEIQALLKIAGVPLPLVCTAKDAVKLEHMGDIWGLTQVWIMETRVEFGSWLDFSNGGHASGGFSDWWEYWWTEHSGRASGRLA